MLPAPRLLFDCVLKAFAALVLFEVRAASVVVGTTYDELAKPKVDASSVTAIAESLRCIGPQGEGRAEDLASDLGPAQGRHARL